MPKYHQVSKVFAVRTVNRDKEYLLIWKGYGSKADSLVKEEDDNSADPASEKQQSQKKKKCEANVLRRGGFPVRCTIVLMLFFSLM